MISEVHPPRRRGKKHASSIAIERLETVLRACDSLSESWDPFLKRNGYPRYLPSFGALLHDLRAWRDAAVTAGKLPERKFRKVNLAHPNDVRLWLDEVRGQLADLFAAADDATRPPHLRDLGRHIAREEIFEAHVALQDLIQAAEPDDHDSL